MEREFINELMGRFIKEIGFKARCKDLENCNDLMGKGMKESDFKEKGMGKIYNSLDMELVLMHMEKRRKEIGKMGNWLVAEFIQIKNLKIFL